MNLLPFVTAFILLFALGFYATLGSVRARIFEAKHFREAVTKKQTRQNALQSHLFAEIPGKKIFPKPTKKKPSDDWTYSYPRSTPQPGSQLNLTLALQKEADPKTVQAANALLQYLYELTELNTTSILPLLADLYQKHPDTSSLNDLLSTLDTPNPTLYTLIKGTPNYTLRRDHSGIPPLADFFTLGDPKKPFCEFPKASFPVLAAIYSEPSAHRIVQAEKQKSEKAKNLRTLTPSELEELLQNTIRLDR